MFFLNWNWILIGAGIFAVIGLINGYKKGLVKELLNCISLLVLATLIVLLSVGLKSYTQKQIVQMILVIIMLLILSLAHKLLKMALDGIKVLASLPVIKTVDKLAGSLFGIAETIIFIWFVLCLIGMFDLGSVGDYINTCIGESRILSYLYQNNLLVIIGERLLGADMEMKAMDVIMNSGKEIVDIALGK